MTARRAGSRGSASRAPASDSSCGDGYVDPAKGEECDDGNLVDDDGCDNDCTLSCHSDEDCSDGNACNGFETCVDFGALKRCQDGTPPDCGPPDEPQACTEYVCEATAETLEDACLVITEVLCYRDEDGDGFPDEANTTLPDDVCDCPDGYMKRHPDSLWDCNDLRPDVRPGQQSFFERPHCPDGSTAEANSQGPCDDDPEATCWKCESGEDASFDYDCDGIDLPAETRVSRSCGWVSRGCRGDGWQGGLPECGTEADFVLCQGTAGVCLPTEVVQTQSCR